MIRSAMQQLQKWKNISLTILLVILMVWPCRISVNAEELIEDNNENVIVENRDEPQRNPEIEAFVNRLYSVVLGRTPDAAGFENWYTKLSGRTITGTDAGYGFVFSNEYKRKNASDAEFVTMLYNTFLNRQPDSSGYNHWMNKLSNGITRVAVFKGFANSPEFRRLCNNAGIDAGTFVPVNYIDMNDGVTMYIYRCYGAFLGRKPDPTGLNDWTRQLINNELSVQRVAYSFVFSNECISGRRKNAEFIKSLYRGLFGREADGEGLNNWVNALASGMSRVDAFKSFVDSVEFRNMAASFGLGVYPDDLSDKDDLDNNIYGINSGAYIAYDVGANRIIYGKNIDTPMFLASQTKTMTALVVMDHVTDLQAVVTYSNTIAASIRDPAASLAGLIPGKQYTVEMLLKGMLICSGSDCAATLAHYVAGNNGNFAQLMNAKARELGVTNSVFSDPMGLTYNVVPLRQFVKIVKALIENPMLKEIVGTADFYLRDVAGTQCYHRYSTNPFYSGAVRNDPDLYTVNGVKTGTTYSAGCCLTTASYDRFGNRLIGIIWKADTNRNRNNFAKLLLDTVYLNDRNGYRLLGE